MNVSYQTFVSHTLEKSLIFNNHDFIKMLSSNSVLSIDCMYKMDIASILVK